MVKRAQKISGKWIEQAREFFIDFLEFRGHEIWTYGSFFVTRQS